MIAPAAPAERRNLVLLALTTLLPLVALSLWARFTSPAAWEPGILAAIALGEDVLGDAIRALNTMGNLPIWAVIVALAAAVMWRSRGAWAALLVGVSLAGDLAAFALKIVIERQRPDTVATELFFGSDSFSFPSGHVVRAVALVAALVWVLAPPGVRLRLALVAGLITGVVMGYARVALGVHWPTDALGGLLLGLGWFALTCWALAKPAAASPT